VRRGTAALLVAIASSGVAASVAAQSADKAVRLDWIAPEECPDAAYVDREVARLLAGDPVSPEKRLNARAEVTKTASAWRVRIRTNRAGGSGDRTLDAESCRAAADATALILALAVDPARVAANRAAPASSSAPPVTSSAQPATSAPEPATSAPEPATSAPRGATSATETATAAPRPATSPGEAATARAKPATSAAEPAAAPTDLAASLGGVLDSAWLPHASAGAFASFGVLPGPAPWLRLDLSAAIFAGASTGIGTARGGDFAMRAFDLAACFFLVRDVVELAPCSGVDLAWIAGSGNGASSPNSGSALLPSARAGGLFAVRLAPSVYLRLDGAMLVALARPEFVVGGNGGGTVHKPAALSARAALGFELRF